jgi:tryptophan synthase alpha chain
MEISAKFKSLAAKEERALVLFVTAGDPSLEQLPQILAALDEGGADFIEVGIPFSDPIADGPIIQASSQAALDRGVTPLQVLQTLAEIQMDTPLVAMGYYNTALRLALPNYAAVLRSSGVSGCITSDLTPEEAHEWKSACAAEKVDTIFLAAPTSTDERLDKVCAASTGFVYAVSRTGVTGTSNQVSPDVRDLVTRIKHRTDLPVCVGFGISTPEHVRLVCEVADGAVVGSWLVDWLAKNWDGGKGRSELVRHLRTLKEATRQVKR